MIGLVLDLFACHEVRLYLVSSSTSSARSHSSASDIADAPMTSCPAMLQSTMHLDLCPAKHGLCSSTICCYVTPLYLGCDHTNGVLLLLLLLHCQRLQVLLGYRLQWPCRTTKALMSAALAYHIATRLLQTVMVLYMIIGWASYAAVRTTPAFIVVATLFGALSVIQAYTLVIYCAIGSKLNKPLTDTAGQISAAEWLKEHASAMTAGRAVFNTKKAPAAPALPTAKSVNSAV
jgi:hypothetical protein